MKGKEFMLRIVGVQRDQNPQREFVLLQNQGHMRVSLRGQLVMSESAFEGRLDACAHLFTDDVHIAPGLFVLLMTGKGEPQWTKTRDGAHVYRTFMNREDSVWLHCSCPLHCMAANHSYVSRGEALMLR
jgi:hypothetical protein